jgi:hypothetical protein
MKVMLLIKLVCGIISGPNGEDMTGGKMSLQIITLLDLRVH